MVEAQRGPSLAPELPRPVSRLSDGVVDVLRRMILRGELQPGERLLQLQLAERLGISRTPLREAFRTLAGEGLLRISNGNKTVEVVDLDRDSLIETFQVREMIDALAARLAARRGLDDATRRRMKSLLERMETFAADPKPDIAAYAEALADFRLAIMAASGNSRLAEFASLVRISTQLQLVKFMQSGLDGIPSNSVPDALHVTIERQRALFAALVDGDAEHAQALATQYAARTLQYLQTLPDPEDAAESDRAAG